MFYRDLKKERVWEPWISFFFIAIHIGKGAVLFLRSKLGMINKEKFMKRESKLHNKCVHVVESLNWRSKGQILIPALPWSSLWAWLKGFARSGLNKLVIVCHCCDGCDWQNCLLNYCLDRGCNCYTLLVGSNMFMSSAKALLKLYIKVLKISFQPRLWLNLTSKPYLGWYLLLPVSTENLWCTLHKGQPGDNVPVWIISSSHKWPRISFLLHWI